MEGDNAAYETEFGCTQGASFTPLDRDPAGVEERREGRGVMGVRMRIVSGGEEVEMGVGRGEGGEWVVEEEGSVMRLIAAVVVLSRAVVR